MGTRRSRFLAAVLSAALAVLAVAVTAPRASASSGPGFATMRGIDAYLRSRGVDPGTAVRQAGPRNYVGPACPGAGWNCIAPTHRPVVQVAPHGGVNVFDCSAGAGGGCFALQVNTAGNNQYTCYQQVSGGTDDTLDSSGCALTQVNTAGANQGTVVQQTRQTAAGPQAAAETAGSASAPISQTNDSGANQLTIEQQSEQDSSDTPVVAQVATVSQVNGTGQNQVTVTQQVHQQVSDAAAAQDQEATEAVCITQDSPNGRNQATVTQQVSQHEQDSAAGISQAQNKNPGPFTSCGNGAGAASTTIAPNLAALVLQDENTPAAAGTNQETVRQSLAEQQQSATRSGSVSQLQGFNGGGLGGLEAIPDQNSTGLSQADTDQHERQTMRAATTGTLSQTQYDPIHQPAGEGVQGTNPADTFRLFQDGTQLAGPAASQNYDFDGFCSTSGTCDVQQNVTTNAGTQHFSCTLSFCFLTPSNE